MDQTQFPFYEEQRWSSDSGINPPEQKKTSVAGLLIIGTEPNCGKTVLLTGLTATLKKQGFSVAAVKPIQFGPKKAADAELKFISSITGTVVDYPVQHLNHLGKLNSPNWQYDLLCSQKKAELTLIELPGSGATPLFIEENENNSGMFWKDTADIACQLNFPCLVVANHAEDALEKLIATCAYLRTRSLDIIGLATVETVVGGGTLFEHMSRAQVELALHARTHTKYIGCIKHSPSISVPHNSQGNLIKMTSAGIDLLLLIKELNLAVPV